MVRPGSHAPGVDPLQSLHVLLAVRSLPTGSGFLEVLRPFDDVPRTSPVCSGSSCSAAVPLSGFLDLSAVSWHVRAWRPCFVPPPPVGFSLQSVAPRWDRVRLSASLAPLQLSTAVPEVRCTRPRPPGFPDARALRRGGLVPHRSSTVVSVFQPLTLSRSGAPGPARSRARAVDDFLDDLSLMHRSHLVPVASAASKLSSPRESVPTARRFRGRTEADALLGFAPPEL
jgi:hypothetical protein